MKLGIIINSFLVPLGYKIVMVDPPTRMTFTELRLLRELTDLNAVYNRYVFDRELTIDEEGLKLLSISMYTRFGTGLWLVSYLRQSLALEGDVCEFGVGQGAISALLAHEIHRTDKKIWLFDIFEGFTEHAIKDIRGCEQGKPGSGEIYDGAISFPENMVRTRLSDLNFPHERIRIVPGFIEKTIQGPVLPRTVCFAYVDMNYYEPVSVVLRFLDEVLQPGGVIIVDDYDFVFRGVKSAVDEFFASRKDRYTLDFPGTPQKTFCVLSRRK